MQLPKDIENPFLLRQYLMRQLHKIPAKNKKKFFCNLLEEIEKAQSPNYE